jgi:hypothetical protein
LRTNQELSHLVKLSYFENFSPVPSFLPALDLPLFNIPKIDQPEGFEKFVAEISLFCLKTGSGLEQKNIEKSQGKQRDLFAKFQVSGSTKSQRKKNL